MNLLPLLYSFVVNSWGKEFNCLDGSNEKWLSFPNRSMVNSNTISDTWTRSLTNFAPWKVTETPKRKGLVPPLGLERCSRCCTLECETGPDGLFIQTKMGIFDGNHHIKLRNQSIMKKNKDSRPLKTQFKALQISIVVLHHIAKVVLGWCDRLWIHYSLIFFWQKSPSLWLSTPRLLCRTSPQASTGLCAASLCVGGDPKQRAFIWWDAREDCSMIIGRISWWPSILGDSQWSNQILWLGGYDFSSYERMAIQTTYLAITFQIHGTKYVGLTWKSNWEKHISSNLIKAILSNPRFTFQANNQSTHQPLERQGANVSSSTTCA